MPLEIRELVIKASVGGESNTTTNRFQDSSENKGGESMINEIVDKVLEIIKEKNER